MGSCRLAGGGALGLGPAHAAADDMEKLILGFSRDENGAFLELGRRICALIVFRGYRGYRCYSVRKPLFFLGFCGVGGCNTL